MAAYVLALSCVAVSVGVSQCLPQRGALTLLLLFYLLMNVAYCVKLKHIAIVDVFIIAVGFVLRILVGGVATNIVLSPWIVLMTFLLALFLGFAKRRYYITAYGDSSGDRQLLAYADEAHYKPFRQGTSSRERLGEVLRFGVVGVAATAIQYGVYLLLCQVVLPQWANTVGYLVSFVFNFVASTRYTFRVGASVGKGVGFAVSHLVNYLMQTGLLTLFLYVGMPRQWALLPVFAVCVPVNFLLVRKALGVH